MELGTPQCSVLGPSLFLLHIKDMPEGITSKVRLFADDTIAYLTISSDQDTRTLQSDLDKLAKWETSWLMAFHSEKCNVLFYYIEKKSNKVQLHSPRTFT
jgi:hypothetical protein